jgi:hypothetical protein
MPLKGHKNVAGARQQDLTVAKVIKEFLSDFGRF